MDNAQTTVRSATVSRDTLETQITVSVCLDGTGKAEFDTGLPFLATGVRLQRLDKGDRLADVVLVPPEAETDDDNEAEPEAPAEG